jgi:hypothetical protein
MGKITDILLKVTEKRRVRPEKKVKLPDISEDPDIWSKVPDKRRVCPEKR